MYGTRTMGKNGTESKTGEVTDGKNIMGGAVGTLLHGLTIYVEKSVSYVTPGGWRFR